MRIIPVSYASQTGSAVVIAIIVAAIIAVAIVVALVANNDPQPAPSQSDDSAADDSASTRAPEAPTPYRIQATVLSGNAEAADTYQISFRVENVGSEAGAARCSVVAYDDDRDLAYGTSSGQPAAVDVVLEPGESRQFSIPVFIEADLADDVNRSTAFCFEWDDQSPFFDPVS